MSSKKTKADEAEEQVEEIDPKVQQVLDQIEPLENQIEELEKKREKEILDIEFKFAKEAVPLLKKRNQLAEKIPQFWLTAFKNHHLLREFFTESDAKLLAHLKDFELEVLDANNSVRITFKFSDNEFLQNNTLWKEFICSDEGVTSKGSDIKWKPGKDLTQEPKAAAKKGNKRGAEEIEQQVSFFHFFTNDEKLQFEQEMEASLREVFAEPVRYYKDLEGEDDDEEEEVEEFDDEGEAQDDEEGDDE